MTNENRSISRRHALATIGVMGAASMVSGAGVSDGWAESNATAAPTDDDIFNFALNLETLETEYYMCGTVGRGLDAEDRGSNPGAVTGGRVVPWQNQDLKEFMEEVALNELAHVRFYRRALGRKTVSAPRIDLTEGFRAAAEAAGLGSSFDPFASEMNFFLGGMLMEDVGVTAYHGAATVLKSKANLDAAVGIMAVEAYHMGMARSTLYRMGAAARNAANALSDARDRVDGPGEVDQGISVNGRANIVPADGDRPKAMSDGGSHFPSNRLHRSSGELVLDARADRTLAALRGAKESNQVSAELRHAICEYVACLKSDGLLAEHGVIVLNRLMQQAGIDKRDSDRAPLVGRVIGLCVDEFYREDTK